MKTGLWQLVSNLAMGGERRRKNLVKPAHCTVNQIKFK